MSAPQAAPGQIVGAQYAVQGLLRHHGPSATYHALTTPQREVAIKLFDPELRVQSEAKLFLEQTIALTNALPANLAAHVIDHGFDPEVGAPFTVTDLSFQPSLVQLVQLCPLSTHEASALLTQIARAMGAAHAEGLAHLSLKPSNLFVGPTPTFETKVADFGASKLRRMLSAEVSPVDVPWIAPEQLEGDGSPRSDLFSAALVLFFALTGRSYWRSCQAKIDVAGWKSELRAPRTAASARAGELGITIGVDVDRVFERGLAVDPSARFRSIAEFAAAFETAVGATAPPLRAEASLAITDHAGAPGPDGTAGAASIDTHASGIPGRSSLARGALMVAAGIAVALVGVAALRSLGAPSHAESATMASVATATEPAPVVPAAAPAAEPAPAAAAAEPAASNARAAETPSAPETVPANAAVPDAGSMQLAAKGNEPAQLTVRCQPACEMIFVDNKKVEAAVPVSVSPGTHLVAGGRSGYPAHTERVTLAPGEKHVTTMTLILQKPAPPKPSKPCGKFLKRCD